MRSNETDPGAPSSSAPLSEPAADSARMSWRLERRSCVAFPLFSFASAAEPGPSDLEVRPLSSKRSTAARVRQLVLTLVLVLVLVLALVLVLVMVLVSALLSAAA